MKALKLIATVLLITSTSILVNAQENQVRNTKDFTKIDVSEGIFVEVSMGDKYHIEVIADENIIDDVITEVDDSELNIYMKGNNFKLKSKQVIVKITATTLSKLKASSGSSLISQNLIDSDDLTMKVSSGATLKVAYKAPRSSCDASSGSSAYLKGVTKYFKAEASSGSSKNAKNLEAINVNANVSSGASISISCEEELSADASSGGSVQYSGNPKLVDIEKSSGGSVNKR